jgi:hypothetical protein
VGKIYAITGKNGGVPTAETLIYSAGTITSATDLVKDLSDFGGDIKPIRGDVGQSLLCTITGGTGCTVGYISVNSTSIGGRPRHRHRSSRQ